MTKLACGILIMLFSSIQTLGQTKEQERFVYNLNFGFLRAGKATFVARDSSFNQLPASHLAVWGRTVGVVDALYSVDDRYESIIDPTSKLPYKAIRNAKERNYRYYNEVVFDQKLHTAQSQKSGKRKVPAKITDMLSIFFYFRQDNLLTQMNIGDTTSLPMWHSDKIHTLKIKYLGIKTLKTKFGKMKCHVISPQAKKGKLFKKTDAITLWFSNDSNLVPMLLELDIRYGSLRCELIEYKKRDGVHLKRR